MSLITVKNLTLSYGEHEVIKNARFSIKKGDFTCVVGANGSGKSALIKSILGFIRPKSVYSGYDLWDLVVDGFSKTFCSIRQSSYLNFTLEHRRSMV